ncbi:transposase [candidate division WOR-3 bacterium]|nr:transposase [candidate division WOR-3 bacterium]
MQNKRFLKQRKSIRLNGFDYSQEGLYFVTICTNNQVCFLGEVLNDEMVLTDAGRLVEKWWLKLPDKFPNIELDYYVVMPNHFHGIISIVGADPCVCPDNLTGEHAGSPLHSIMQWFKTMSTNEYIRGVKQLGWMPFNKKFWQRSYYEHIIRNEKELNRIREYIQNNPLKWELDRENPESKYFNLDHDLYWREVYGG